jgi:D-glycerate 3-kinase
MSALARLIREHALPDPYLEMVEAVHRPAAAHIAARRRALGRPIVVGLCGSQGSGKSTMAAFLAALLAEDGLTSAVLSIDDLYLTRAQRERLGAGVHPLLRTRGPPGTHDAGLGLALLDVLTFGGAAEVALPRFDKAEDDRAPAEAWPIVPAPVEVVLLEGWCVGAIPQDEAALAEPVNALERDEDPDGVWRRYVNDQLKGVYAALFERIDVLALLQAPGFEAVYDWRLLQEQKLAERVAREGLAGRRVMSPHEIRRFLMFYQRLTQHILAEMPGRAEIVMPLGTDHRIFGVTIR